MGVETANIVLVVIIVIIFFMLMSACCRQLRAAYEEHMNADQLSRSHPFFIGNGRDEEVRVISHGNPGGDRVFGFYEIRMPRGGIFGRPAPPPPFQTAIQNSSPIFYIDPDEPPPSYDEYIKSQGTFPAPPPAPTTGAATTPSTTTATVVTVEGEKERY